MKDEIIIYQTNQASTRIEVRVDDNTVWLSQEQIASLFGRNRVSITQHIGNIFKEKELIKEVVCKEFLLTTQHGAILGKTQINKIILYNLDVIISVGYRVKSKEGTQFRIWANQVLKDYLLNGQITNYRINNLENDMTFVKTKLNEIDIKLQTNLPPNQGVFFNGQVFDAYVFFSEIIKNAQTEIILIDNYIDVNLLGRQSAVGGRQSAVRRPPTSVFSIFHFSFFIFHFSTTTVFLSVIKSFTVLNFQID
jgi:hypothetical protein